MVLNFILKILSFVALIITGMYAKNGDVAMTIFWALACWYFAWTAERD